jgi:hypothetical protein
VNRERSVVERSVLEDLDPRDAREQYLGATPWPHLVIDDVVAPERLATVTEEVAGLSRAAMLVRRSRRMVKVSTTERSELGPATRALLDYLSGPVVTGLMEAVTDISGLEADPQFCRAGVFVTPPGGWQRVHEDFPIHPQTGLWNRVIMLLYCSDWEPGNGGELELWPPDMRAVGKRIEPRPGRLVMFEPTSAHPHGIDALAADARERVVLASRLYTQGAPSDPPSRPLLRWSRRPNERRRDVWPSASEAARELRAQVRSRLHAGSGNRTRDDY